MKYEFVMPKLGHVMEEGTIGSWEISVGDKVKKGDVILTVETGKTATEVESPIDGTLVELLAEEGDTIEILKPIAVFDAE